MARSTSDDKAAVRPNFRLKSSFAVLDVERGRAKLAAHFAMNPHTAGPTPDRFRIPVTITGYIDGVWGPDDGVSQEFWVSVTDVTVDNG